MKKLISLLTVAIMGLSSFPSARAEVSHGDKSFMEKAAKSGMEEVAISTGAMDRLVNPEVKSFAQMMITDHGKANAELTELALKKGVTLPPKDKHDTDLTEKWSMKTKDGDMPYIKQMVSDHESAVKLFEKGAKSDDADISAFAAKTLPTLQHHLDMVNALKASVK